MISVALPVALVAVCSVCAPGAQVKATAKIYDLSARWKKGWVFKGKMRKQTININGGKESSPGTSLTGLTIEIKKANKEGYEIWWTFGETRIENARKKIPPVLQRLGQVNKGIVMKIQCSPGGKPLRLLNEGSMKRQYKMTVETLVDWLRKAGRSEAGIRQMTASMQGMADRIGLIYMNQPTSLLMATGLELKLGVPLDYSDRIRTPFSSRPISTRSQFLLQNVFPKDGTALVQFKQELNPEDMKKALTGRFGDRAPGNLTFQIKDGVTTIIDLHTGMPRSLTMTRSIMSGNRGRRIIHRYTLEKVEPPSGKPKSDK